MRAQRPHATAGFLALAREHVSRAHRPVYPQRRRMLQQRALLPARRLGVVAGLEMRTADPDQAVEGELVLRREVERDPKPLDRGDWIALIDVEPTAAAPGPGRTAIDRQGLADDPTRIGEFIEHGQRGAEHT